MMLVELTQVPTEALPVAPFKDHLRLGTGFADEGAQDSLLATFLRAALATVEGYIGKAVIARQFQWTVPAWRRPLSQIMPTGPVTSLSALTLRDVDGTEISLDVAAYRIRLEPLRSTLAARQGNLPSIPQGGEAVVEFTAGLGADWSEVPATIAQAVLMLAAYYYEYRDVASGSAGQLPNGVAALLGPWRDLRIGGSY